MNTRPKKNQLRVGILGWGEVGKAIGSFYANPFIEDSSSTQTNTFDDASAIGGLDILHVCIPYSSAFVETVVKYIKLYAPQGITIIHSTVPVGTTQAVRKEAGIDGMLTVHSPVRGVHPNLAHGIKTFVKYIGTDSPDVGLKVMEHFKKLGIKGAVVYNSKTTELAKLLDTTYYGLCIAFHDYAAALCDKENLAFERVMTDPNESYNAGYTKLGKKNVVRPVLYPPADNKIGGHCVIPNADLLAMQYGVDPLLDAILRHK